MPRQLLERRQQVLRLHRQGVKTLKTVQRYPAVSATTDL
jgi:hypothetical protein